MKSLKQIKVLIAEDDPVALEALTVYLQDQGHEVVTAGNGLGAEVALKAFRPDVVVTDHIMPALDGLGFLKRVRQTPETRLLPVVLISALADGPELQALSDEVVKLQPAALLRKPFDPPALLAVIREMPRQPGAGDSRVDLSVQEVPHA